MSRKLHKFQTEAEYQAYSASTEYTTPCVALIVDTNVIYYDYGSNKPQAPDLSDYKGEFQESSIGGDKYGKSAITKINYIPTGITSLGDGFENYSSLQEVTCEIPSGVTDMDFTFAKCQSLINAPSIPSGVTSMEYTFSGCKSLVNAPVIPDSVEDVMCTFEGCSSLITAPAIPNSVTQMYRTFKDCSTLKEVTFLHTTPLYYFDELEGCSKLETIYVPDSALEDYRTATGWLQFASKFKPLSSKPSE